MNDEWVKNRKLDFADTYPKLLNGEEICNYLKVKASLFDGYTKNQSITYTFLVSVDKNGKVIDIDYQGGDNMRIIEEVKENVKELKFQPGLKNNLPINSYSVVTYHFKVNI